MKSRDPASIVSREILEQFDHFYADFREITYSAKLAFERQDYSEVLMASRSRLAINSISMNRLSRQIVEKFPKIILEESLWVTIEGIYRLLIHDRYEVDLAPAYMNSVRRAFFQREWNLASYSIGDGGFTRPVKIGDVLKVFETTNISTEVILDVLSVPEFLTSFERGLLDAKTVSIRVEKFLERRDLVNCVQKVAVLRGEFFRNRGAYVVSRIECSNQVIVPLLIALLNSKNGIYVDAVINSIPDTHNLFSSTLANFHVSNDYYHEICKFLGDIMPQRALGPIYSTIGFNHFGKVAVVGELTKELSVNRSVLDSAISFKGTVAIGFQFVDSSYSLKVIRDKSSENYKWGAFKGVESALSKYRRVY